MKRSPGKATLPGCKQVHRIAGEDGVAVRDVLALAGEDVAGRPLLRHVMEDGRRCGAADSLENGRRRAAAAIAALPPALRRLDAHVDHPVELSDGLRALVAEVEARTG